LIAKTLSMAHNPIPREDINMPKRIPDETREKVVEAHYSGLSNNKIAKKYRISATSVARILKESAPKKALQKSSLKGAESIELKRQISRIDRRIADLEDKIRYFESKKKGTGVKN
jgi:hypothetical protein